MLPEPLDHNGHGPDIVVKPESLLGMSNMCRWHGKGAALYVGWTNSRQLDFSVEPSHAASQSNQKSTFSFQSGTNAGLFA